MDFTEQEIFALDRSITPARMGAYRAAAAGDPGRARELYLRDRRLAGAFLADLGLLEVALRNAMNRQLALRWGDTWYHNREMPLDDRSLAALSRAWAQVSGERTPGRVVSSCMLGFWRGLLDRGDHVGRPPRRARCDYEVLWRGVLDRAFPGGRAISQADAARWNRDYAHGVVSRVNDLRNRVAHHEPLVNGFPLSGQRRRLSVGEAAADCLRLAGMLDRDLESVLRRTSAVPRILNQSPQSS